MLLNSRYGESDERLESSLTLFLIQLQKKIS